MERVYEGLGSNLGDRLATLRQAVNAIADTPGCGRPDVSSVYETRPMGPEDQPDYANAVCRFACTLSPEQLLSSLQGIEAAAGRDRSGGRWRERTLDLDILLFGERLIDTPELCIPHRGIPERSFVLLPLAELEPTLYIPGMGAVSTLLPDSTDYQLGILGTLNE